MASPRETEPRGEPVAQDPIVLKNGIAVLTPDPIAEGAFGQVYVGKILNPIGLLAERVVWGEESPHWLGLDEVPYAEPARGELPSPMTDAAAVKRVYQASARLWHDYMDRRREDKARADQEFADLLNLIDPMLHEDRVIAVKVLRPPGLKPGEPEPKVPPEPVRRFIKENDLLRTLRHPGIVRRFGLVKDDRMGWCILLEYLDGETLDVHQRRHEKNRMPAAQAAALVLQIADALQYIHEQGVVHRDLKPQNVMVRRDDGRAVIMDFGIGKWVDESQTAQLTMSGVRVGTPRYMAPEQAAAEAPVGREADVYQLSTIFFELLVGQPAYAGMEVAQIFEWLLDPARPHPSALRYHLPDVSRELEVLIEVGRDKAPATRWSIEEFRDRLQRIVAEKRFEGAAGNDARNRPEVIELLRQTRVRRKEIQWEERELGERLRFLDLQARVQDAWSLLERKDYLDARPVVEVLVKESVAFPARYAPLKKDVEKLDRAFTLASARHEAESLVELAERHEAAGRFGDAGAALDAAAEKLAVLPKEAYADIHHRFRELSERYETSHRMFVELLGTLRKSFIEKIQNRTKELFDRYGAKKKIAASKVEDLLRQLDAAEKNLHAIERDKAGPVLFDAARKDLEELRVALADLLDRAVAEEPASPADSRPPSDAAETPSPRPATRTPKSDAVAPSPRPATRTPRTD
jgi:serine/threonine protein kinase